jgi:hypothetical protein
MSPVFFLAHVQRRTAGMLRCAQHDRLGRLGKLLTSRVSIQICTLSISTAIKLCSKLWEKPLTWLASLATLSPRERAVLPTGARHYLTFDRTEPPKCHPRKAAG